MGGAIKAYTDQQRREIDRVRRNLRGLSNDDKASLIWAPESQVQAVEEAIDKNVAFLEKIAALMREYQAGASVKPDENQLDCGLPPKAVQNLLNTFVREWSEEGLAERQECYRMLLDALRQYATPGTAQQDKARVLVLGSKLSRLLFEVQASGFPCEGVEGKPLMYFGSEFVRREFSKREAHVIQPFAANTCNRLNKGDHVRTVPMPEVDVGANALPPVTFGNFLQVFDSPETRASRDAAVTAFTLDTSFNVLRFVRTVAHVVRPGGLWTNFGPLFFGTDDDEAHGHGVELSGEELRRAVSYFFDVKEWKFVSAMHASNGRCLMQIEYTCIFFAVVRNEVPSRGIGGV